jgi:hypothetical protein
VDTRTFFTLLNACQDRPALRVRYADSARGILKACRRLGIAAPEWVYKAIILKSRYEYCSTQFNCSEALADILRSWCALYIPEADLSGNGLDKKPHITVRYGIESATPEEVANLVSGFGPVEVQLGPVSVFRSDDYDVVKLDVESTGLRRLNRLLGRLPHTDTYANYSPHLTLAYVKSGSGGDYLGMQPYAGQVTFDTLILSDRNGTHTAIPLADQSLRSGVRAATELLALGNQVAKGVRGVTKREMKIGDWDHPMDDLEGRDHEYHVRHHTREFMALRQGLVTEQDPEKRREIIHQMRRCARHAHMHNLTRYAKPPAGIPTKTPKLVFKAVR